MRPRPRLIATVVALVIGIGACANRGKPFEPAVAPTTTAPTDTASLLAAARADRAERIDLLGCPRELGTTMSESFAVAFVAPSDESRELAAPLPMPGLGDEAAQLRALVDHVNTCGGRPIELHIHRDYTLSDDFSLGRLCDDVTVNERNDLVIARGLPPDALKCVAETTPVLYIGDAERDNGRHFTAIGPNADLIAQHLVEDVVEADPAISEPIGIIYDVRFTDFVERNHADLTRAEIEFDEQLGCVGLDAARDRFRASEVRTVIALLDERCLPSTGLALDGIGVQWIIGPLGVGTGDDAIASIAAVGDTFDGAYAVSGMPRAIIRDRLPSPPPAFGEACNAITSVQGEDYEFGIGEYTALEQLCIAVALTASVSQLGDPSPATITEALRDHDEFPLPSNQLGGFAPDTTTSADDVFYVQRYSANCGCWTYVAGPIARG
jgi:hypothetical protein